VKSAIIYYSYSGNTKKVAGILAEYLKEKYEVNLIELKARDESKNFFGQCNRAFWHKRATIEETNIDLSEYNLVCFGTPVWAFGPAPAMNTYLDMCFGLEGKDAVIFSTYGSGTGKDRCMDHIEKILKKKGVISVRRFSVQQFRIADKEHILSQIG
jgi:flavodoxin